MNDHILRDFHFHRMRACTWERKRASKKKEWRKNHQKSTTTKNFSPLLPAKSFVRQKRETRIALNFNINIRFHYLPTNWFSTVNHPFEVVHELNSLSLLQWHSKNATSQTIRTFFPAKILSLNERNATFLACSLALDIFKKIKSPRANA